MYEERNESASRLNELLPLRGQAEQALSLSSKGTTGEFVKLNWIGKRSTKSRNENSVDFLRLQHLCFLTFILTFSEQSEQLTGCSKDTS